MPFPCQTPLVTLNAPSPTPHHLEARYQRPSSSGNRLPPRPWAARWRHRTLSEKRAMWCSASGRATSSWSTWGEVGGTRLCRSDSARPAGVCSKAGLPRRGQLVSLRWAERRQPRRSGGRPAGRTAARARLHAQRCAPAAARRAPPAVLMAPPTPAAPAAAGSFGAVMLCNDDKTGQLVAIKQMVRGSGSKKALTHPDLLAGLEQACPCSSVCTETCMQHTLGMQPTPMHACIFLSSM